jgi:hypothetical protein
MAKTPKTKSKKAPPRSLIQAAASTKAKPAKSAKPAKRSRVSKSQHTLTTVSNPTKAKPIQDKTRKLKTPNYKSFRLHKRIKHPRPQLTNAFKLFWHSLLHLRTYWKVFGGILLIYGILNLILVRGFSGGADLQSLKNNLYGAINGSGSQLASSLSLFGVLLSTAGNTATAAAASYQTFLVVLISLVLIWALRQTQAGNKVTIRQSFYNGAAPLVPFLLVLSVIALQLIPLVIGSFMYSIVISNLIATSFLAKFFWIMVFALLALLSLYMVSSSVFALYIVTLPGLTPMKALRSARQLVLHRRWMVIRKVIVLPLILVAIGAIMFIPIILWLTPAATWLFFVATIVALGILHSYMYSLYRELL